MFSLNGPLRPMVVEVAVEKQELGRGAEQKEVVVKL